MNEIKGDDELKSKAAHPFLVCADCGKPAHPDTYFYARGVVEGMTIVTRLSGGESRGVFIRCCRGPQTLSATRYARPNERCLHFWPSTDAQQASEFDTCCAVCRERKDRHPWSCDNCGEVTESSTVSGTSHDCIAILREKLRLRDALLEKEAERIALRDGALRTARMALSERTLLDLVETTRDSLYVVMTAPGSKSIRDRLADVNLVAIVRGFLAVRAPGFGSFTEWGEPRPQPQEASVDPAPPKAGGAS